MNVAIRKNPDENLLHWWQLAMDHCCLSFILPGAILLLASFSLVGCGGGTTNEANPGAGGTNLPTGYSGPPPETPLVQAYYTEFWNPIVSPTSGMNCVGCHGTGGQAPSFLRNDDINQAYRQAITVANLSFPEQSILVTKVAGGHNCWLASNTACADSMTGYIRDWASAGGVGTGGKEIILTAPTDRDISNSRPFPASPFDNPGNSFAETVYPVLVANCSGCHSPVGPAGRQQPYFAYDDGDPATDDDVISSYEAAKAKIDLSDADIPAFDPNTMDLDTWLEQVNSLFAVRVRELHNCWTTDCANDAFDMATAIREFAGAISPVVVDSTLITSRALLFSNDCDAPTQGYCIVASGGNRYEENQIALWEFKDGAGTAVSETSRAGTPIILELSGNYSWLGGYGIQFTGGKAQDISGASSRINSSINPAAGGNGEYSIEAWAVPGNVTQEDANIVSYSGGDGAARNFTLGQTMYNYDFLHLSDTTQDPENDRVSTPAADEVLQATQQHVVVTFDPVNGRRIYVNGVLTNAMDPFTPGSLADWDDTYALALGNEVSDDRPWSGTLRLVSIHDRALSHEHIVQNFEAGVGQKFFLLFGVDHIPGIPAGSYIMLEVSQFDSYSYLFYKPTFINLNGAVVDGIAIKGIRIGVNGSVPIVGQAFSNIDTTIDSSVYTAEDGQVLSILGTVIPLERGMSASNPDEFFLSFELLGTASNPFIEPTPPPLVLLDPDPVPDIGFRTFEEIYTALSELTGVSTTNSTLRSVYDTYIQQLPTVESMEGFLPSHQMAITQLALTYCSELVDNNGSIPRDTYFTGFDFSQPANSAFDATGRQQIIDPLLKRMMNIDLNNSANNLLTQPDETVIRDMLSATNSQQLDPNFASPYESLITHMINQCTRTDPPYAGAACSTSARTTEIVKATCAAVLGSAAAMVQ
jgi:mono/diheme cytochrome c family protein